MQARIIAKDGDGYYWTEYIPGGKSKKYRYHSLEYKKVMEVLLSGIPKKKLKHFEIYLRDIPLTAVSYRDSQGIQYSIQTSVLPVLIPSYDMKHDLEFFDYKIEDRFEQIEKKDIKYTAPPKTLFGKDKRLIEEPDFDKEIGSISDASLLEFYMKYPAHFREYLLTTDFNESDYFAEMNLILMGIENGNLETLEMLLELSDINPKDEHSLKKIVEYVFCINEYQHREHKEDPLIYLKLIIKYLKISNILHTVEKQEDVIELINNEYRMSNDDYLYVLEKPDWSIYKPILHSLDDKVYLTIKEIYFKKANNIELDVLKYIAMRGKNLTIEEWRNFINRIRAYPNDITEIYKIAKKYGYSPKKKI